jgi:hypothetical protein
MGYTFLNKHQVKSHGVSRKSTEINTDSFFGWMKHFMYPSFNPARTLFVNTQVDNYFGVCDNSTGASFSEEAAIHAPLLYSK